MDPIKTPHLHEAEKDRIVPLICSAGLDMFVCSNCKPPQSVVIVTLYESTTPPLLKIWISP